MIRASFQNACQSHRFFVRKGHKVTLKEYFKHQVEKNLTLPDDKKIKENQQTLKGGNKEGLKQRLEKRMCETDMKY